MMKRRDFLKYLSAIPFLGTLLAQGESGASEGQRGGGLIGSMLEDFKRDGGGCHFAGPGRGDCTNFIGLPGKSIPNQHDGDDDTVDAYGKPNGWCWFCWHGEQIRRLEKELTEWQLGMRRSGTEMIYNETTTGHYFNSSTYYFWNDPAEDIYTLNDGEPIWT